MLVKDVIQQTHKCGKGIGQAKQNYYKFIIPISGPKICFVNIFFLNHDMVVTRPQIQLGEDFFSPYLIKKIIYLR